MMINGVRKDKCVKTVDEALAQVQFWESSITNQVTEAEIAELILCRNKLQGKATLLDAVNYFIEQRAFADAPSIKEAYKQFIEWEEQSGRSKLHIRTLKTHSRAFLEHFSEKIPGEVSTPALVSWAAKLGVSGKSARTQRNEINAARNFLSWCKTKNWIANLPVINERVMPRMETKEPEIYTAAEIQEFFDLLEAEYPEAIPHFAVRAFLGLRTSEAERLTWEDVEMETRMLRVRAKKTKTGRARTLDGDLVPDTAFVWLEKYGEYSFHVSTKKQKAIANKFGKFKHNALRKSFATMLTSLRKNQQETMLATGHTNMQTLKRHYEGTKQARAEAQAYFSVMPKMR